MGNGSQKQQPVATKEVTKEAKAPPDPKKLKELAAASEDSNLIKLLLVGDHKVGKSCLLHRFHEDKFNQFYTSTVGVEVSTKAVADAEGKMVKLQIRDSSGDEKYRMMTASYYHAAHGIIVVYDVTRRETFDHVRKWLENIDRLAGEKVNVLILGNKSDLGHERAISRMDAHSYADGFGIPFMETSAKEGRNVEEAFMAIAGNIKKRLK